VGGTTTEPCKPSSPVIFNIVVNAIIRDVEACRLKELATNGQVFYVDDGVIADKKPKKVQKLADNHTERFARVGLKINNKKGNGN
jgi:hypothetical protein